MKRYVCLIIVYSILTLILTSCSSVQGDSDKDLHLQRLSQVDIYSQDGILIKSVSDESTLRELSDVVGRLTPDDIESKQDYLRKSVDGHYDLYEIVFYRTPAARFNNGELEEEMRIIVYDDANIIKEIISPNNIKNASIPEEFLTFYYSVSDEDMDLLISLVEDAD